MSKVIADDLCEDTSCAECEIVIIDDEQWMICPVYDSTGAKVGYKATKVNFGGGTTGN